MIFTYLCKYVKIGKYKEEKAREKKLKMQTEGIIEKARFQRRQRERFECTGEDCARQKG